MKRLTRNNLINFDDYDKQIGIFVDSGDELIIETVAPYEKPNLTGPIQISGIQAGDSIAITIKDIKFVDKGVMFFGHDKNKPSSGVLRNKTQKSIEKKIEVVGNVVKFNKKISFNANPMVGWIQIVGKNIIENIGEYGGNMDTKELGIGATLVLHDEFGYGKFLLGDVHESMGDGEICGTGVEIPADVLIKVEVIKNTQKHRPIVVNQDKITLLATDSLHENAYTSCIEDAIRLLKKQHGLSFEETNCLVSATCDLGISTVVSNLFTYKINIPHKLLPDWKDIIQKDVAERQTNYFLDYPFCCQK